MLLWYLLLIRIGTIELYNMFMFQSHKIKQLNRTQTHIHVDDIQYILVCYAIDPAFIIIYNIILCKHCWNAETIDLKVKITS